MRKAEAEADAGIKNKQNTPLTQMFTRKDLILLHKYKDESYKKALVESVTSLARHQVFRAAMNGETIARISLQWASSKEELEDLKKEETQVRDLLSESFKDSKIDVEINNISFIFYQFWEIAVRVNWG
jgi:hypothetical protein